MQDAGCDMVEWCCYMRPELLPVSVAVGYTYIVRNWMQANIYVGHG